MALLSSDHDALAILQSVAESSSSYRDRALQVMIRRMSQPIAKEWQSKMAEDPSGPDMPSSRRG
jgi:hypothetical protein